MRPRLEVSWHAIVNNTKQISAGTGAEVMAVVKADGYGLGAQTVASAALSSGATRLGVVTFEEAVLLRDAGFRQPILAWLEQVDMDWVLAAALDIEVALPSQEYLTSMTKSGARVKVHIQIDTGMAREGCPQDDVSALVSAATAAEKKGHIQIVGVMGHQPFSADPVHPHNAEAVQILKKASVMIQQAAGHPITRHIGATAAALHQPDAHLDLLRVGAGLVGIDPAEATKLTTAACLTAPVVQIHEADRGTGVGYGHAWTAQKNTRLALVPLGYADGIPRSVAGRAEVTLNGKRCPIVGAVSMDQIVVDVGENPVRIGDEVVVLGSRDGQDRSLGPGLEEWASWCNTIPHEVLTRLGGRIERKVVGCEKTEDCGYRGRSLKRA